LRRKGGKKGILNSRRADLLLGRRREAEFASGFPFSKGKEKRRARSGNAPTALRRQEEEKKPKSVRLELLSPFPVKGKKKKRGKSFSWDSLEEKREKRQPSPRMFLDRKGRGKARITSSTKGRRGSSPEKKKVGGRGVHFLKAVARFSFKEGKKKRSNELSLLTVRGEGRKKEKTTRWGRGEGRGGKDSAKGSILYYQLLLGG